MMVTPKKHMTEINCRLVKCVTNGKQKLMWGKKLTVLFSRSSRESDICKNEVSFGNILSVLLFSWLISPQFDWVVSQLQVSHE